MRDIRLIIHDIRSTHNVGALFRTAEGLGVSRIYITGYTPYPAHDTDERLPHISSRLTKQIHKTALGAEQMVEWSHHEDILSLIKQLKNEGRSIIALEQDTNSIPLPQFKAPEHCVLLVGREVEGIDPEILQHADHIVEIPMYGKKESFNVAQATAITLYALRES